MRKNELPPHPGQILLHVFMKPLDITQVELAEHLGISFQRLNEIINTKRAVTPETAILLAQAFRTEPEYWLSQQAAYDVAFFLATREVPQIEPLVNLR